MTVVMCCFSFAEISCQIWFLRWWDGCRGRRRTLTL